MKITSITVTLHAAEKRSPRAYETDERGAHVTYTAALADGDDPAAATTALWTAAEAHLLAQGYVHAKGEVFKSTEKAAPSPGIAPQTAPAAKPAPGPTESAAAPPAAASPAPAAPPTQDAPQSAGAASGRTMDEAVAAWRAMGSRRENDPAYCEMMDYIKQDGGKAMGYASYWRDHKPAQFAEWAKRHGIRTAGGT